MTDFIDISSGLNYNKMRNPAQLGITKMSEAPISNIKLHETDLREAIEWKLKGLQRAINMATDQDIKAIHQRHLDRFRKALMTINQLELIPAPQQDKNKPK